MTENRYLAKDSPDAFERERLALLTQFTDPITTRRLTDLGVGPGWRCLDVAAGNGSVARWLAGRVGREGRVVATDLNPRFRIRLKAMMLFRDAPAAICDEGVDSLLVDQIEMAGGTVAEHLGLPFVSVAAALPINSDPSVPPVTLPWAHRVGVGARLRNRLGNAATEW